MVFKKLQRVFRKVERCSRKYLSKELKREYKKEDLRQSNKSRVYKVRRGFKKLERAFTRMERFLERE